MENLIVIRFPDGGRAKEALNKLQELDQLGDIAMYNYALIRKSNGKDFEIVQHDGSDLDGLPAAGAISGSLVGLIGGPIGMAIGMLTGVLVGSAGEADDLDFTDEVLEKVKGNLVDGEYAIVLDVEEDNDYFINSYMDPFQGILSRTDIAGQFDKYDQEQWDELNNELDDAEKSLKTAVEKDKASIQVKIDKLKKERSEKLEKLKARSAKRKKVLDDKIKVLDEKIKKSGENAQASIKESRRKLAEKLSAAKAKLDWAFA
jgi:uncharacterized membrane protein